jgi:hypothetical protein
MIPESFFTQYKIGLMDLPTLTQWLMDLIDFGYTLKTRTRSLEILGELELRTVEIFEFLCELALADKDHNIRKIALKITKRDFPDKRLVLKSPNIISFTNKTNESQPEEFKPYFSLNQILTQYAKGLIDKLSLKASLFTLIANSEDSKVRCRSIKLIGKYLLDLQDIHRFLEYIIISDEDNQIRARACRIIIENFFKDSQKVIDWLIENETSSTVLHTLVKYIEKRSDTSSIRFLELLKDKVESKYNLPYKEAKALLDLEHSIGDIKHNKWYTTKNNSVEDLELDFCSLRGVLKFPDSVKNLQNLQKLFFIENEITGFNGIEKMESKIYLILKSFLLLKIT